MGDYSIVLHSTFFIDAIFTLTSSIKLMHAVHGVVSSTAYFGAIVIDILRIKFRGRKIYSVVETHWAICSGKLSRRRQFKSYPEVQHRGLPNCLELL